MAEIYQHYKGGIYNKLSMAMNTETDAQMIIYSNSRGVVFARPADLFYGEVIVDGEAVERFKFLGKFATSL